MLATDITVIYSAHHNDLVLFQIQGGVGAVETRQKYGSSERVLL